MKHEMKVGNGSLVVDPESKYPKWDALDMYKSFGGMIPQWINYNNPDPMYKQVINAYPFYSHEAEGGVMDRETLRYKYPGDPEMVPLIVFRRTVARLDLTSFEDILVIYESGFVGGFFNGVGGENEQHGFTRMD